MGRHEKWSSVQKPRPPQMAPKCREPNWLEQGESAQMPAQCSQRAATSSSLLDRQVGPDEFESRGRAGQTSSLSEPPTRCAKQPFWARREESVAGHHLARDPKRGARGTFALSIARILSITSWIEGD